MSYPCMILGGALLMVTACGGGMRGAQPFEVPAVRVESAAPIPRSPQDARVIVRRASMEVEVEAVTPAVDRATALAQSFEGYVENVTTHEDKNASLRLRVPSTRLHEALDSLARLGKVTSRTLSEDDVTVQSVDLEARVASLRAARDKLRELLDRAATVADAVAAQAELARVQADLDSLEAQLRVLQSSASLSPITLFVKRRVVLGPLGVVASAVGTLIAKLFIWR